MRQMQKLSKKFLKVMQECRYIQKAGNNSYYGYKYATSSDVLDKVNSALTSNGIVSVAVPEVISFSDVQNNKGNTEHLATVKITIQLIDTESGETMVIGGLGSGQDSGDKAIMKAQTAAIKYAYLLSLAVSTGDDPEADQQTDENTANGVIQMPMQQTARRTISKATATSGSKKADAPKYACNDCGLLITEKVHQFSVQKFGVPLCMDCQKRVRTNAA